MPTCLICSRSYRTSAPGMSGLCSPTCYNQALWREQLHDDPGYLVLRDGRRVKGKLIKCDWCGNIKRVRKDVEKFCGTRCSSEHYESLVGEL